MLSFLRRQEPLAPNRLTTILGATSLKREDQKFWIFLAICTVIAALTCHLPSVAMWVGFAYAGYSVIANDSIQTLGTFLSANRHRPWWVLWLYVVGIFFLTTYYSWSHYSGDVTYGRLASKGFETAPVAFSFLQICAPLVLLILTRWSIPVSTTFLILSSFATSGTSVKQVLLKSVSGYFVAFACAIALWMVCYRTFEKLKRGEPGSGWFLAQWISSGALWSVWIMQDAANVAVYLPRSLSAGEVFAFCLILGAGMAFLIKDGGGRIQEVVQEKSDVVDVRPATIINLVFAVILYYFKIVSSIPMSTTWVFIGLLAGREFAITLSSRGKNRSRSDTAKMIVNDLVKVSIGLTVSVLLAIVINPVVCHSVFGF